MLDAAALNSFILFKLKNPNNFLVNELRSRRLNLELLACNLIKSCISERLRNASLNNYSGLNANILNSMMTLGFKIDRKNNQAANLNETKKPCYSLECKRSKQKRKSRTANICVECGNFACKAHCEISKLIICNNCILD